MPNRISVTHPKTGRTITVPPEQLPGLKAAGWGDQPTEPAADAPAGQESGQGGYQEPVLPDKATDPRRSTPRTKGGDHTPTTTPESQED